MRSLTGSGGSINFKCTTEQSDCISEVQYNNFTKNSAYHRGGAIYYDNQPPLKLQLNHFSDNNAQYGNNIASIPMSANFVRKTDTEIFRLGKQINIEVQGAHRIT